MEKYHKKTELLMQLHYSRLQEKDRRQYAALESIKLGRGGIGYISSLLSIDPKTISKGRKELLFTDSALSVGRQRKPGGGRKKNGKIS